MDDRIDQFKDYVLDEIAFYKEYFGKTGLIHNIMEAWNMYALELQEQEDRVYLSKTKTIDDLLKYEEKKINRKSQRKIISKEESFLRKKEFETGLQAQKENLKREYKLMRLENSARWNFNSITDWQLVSGGKKERAFDLIANLLEDYRGKFIHDIERFKSTLQHQGRVFHGRGEFMVRLALWSSIFTNDEQGVLSPFGPFGIKVGESMNHLPIGILDALDQQLWDPKWNSDKLKKKENSWRTDLIRSQLLLISIYSSFRNFLKECDTPFDSLNDIFKVWELNKKRSLAGEKVDMVLKDAEIKLDGKFLLSDIDEIKRNYILSQKFIDSIKDWLKQLEEEVSTELDSHVEERTYRIQTIIIFRNILLNPNPASEIKKISGIVQKALNKRIEAKADPVLLEESRLRWVQNLLNDIYNLTYLKSDINHPPLVQFVHGPSSAWASDKEVPTIIVINKNKVCSENLATRILALAALPHEVGHDLSDSFIDDALIKSFNKNIDECGDITYKDIWKGWLNEIFADIMGVAILGTSSIKGLIRVLKDMGVPNDMIPRNRLENGYDPHPVPIIRVFLAIEFAIIYHHHGNRNLLSKILKHSYKHNYHELNVTELYDLYRGGTISVDKLKKETKVIVDILLNTAHNCLKKRTLKDLMDAIRSAEFFEDLTENFKLPDDLTQ